MAIKHHTNIKTLIILKLSITRMDKFLDRFMQEINIRFNKISNQLFTNQFHNIQIKHIKTIINISSQQFNNIPNKFLKK